MGRSAVPRFGGPHDAETFDSTRPLAGGCRHAGVPMMVQSCRLTPGFAELKIAGVSTTTAAARLEQWAGAPTWADGVALEASSVLQRRACLLAPARKDRSRRH